jgi:hypothetical protein
MSRERVDDARDESLGLHGSELLLETLASGGVADTGQHGVDDVEDLGGSVDALKRGAEDSLVDAGVLPHT